MKKLIVGTNLVHERTIPSGDNGDYIREGEFNVVVRDVNNIKSEIDEIIIPTVESSYPVESIEGSVANFNDGADMPIKSLIVNITPVQEGSGTPSSENVRPINGWGEVKIWCQDEYDASADPTVIIDIGDDCYGGTLDATTGELVISMVSVDMSKLDWKAPSQGTNYNWRSDSLGDLIKKPTGNSAKANIICSNLEIQSYNNIYDGTAAGIGVSANNGRLLVKNNDTEHKPSGQLVYELNTPTTIQLDSRIDIKTFLGANSIWAECGNVSVKYYADTTLYINKKISATEQVLEAIITANRESSMKATSAYSSGDLIIISGKLYRATTSIANGATITVGTNVALTTIAAEIAAIT